jgi:hypothetical protein
MLGLQSPMITRSCYCKQLEYKSAVMLVPLTSNSFFFGECYQRYFIRSFVVFNDAKLILVVMILCLVIYTT